VSDRVLAFDMNAARLASNAQTPVRAVETDGMPVAPKRRPRAEARANLAAVYAGLLGGDIAVRDVVDSLTADGADEDPDLSDLATALKAAGQRAQVYDAAQVVA
jgi:ATP-binding cassette subfamily C protein LapB